MCNIIHEVMHEKLVFYEMAIIIIIVVVEIKHCILLKEHMHGN